MIITRRACSSAVCTKVVPAVLTQAPACIRWPSADSALARPSSSLAAAASALARWASKNGAATAKSELSRSDAIGSCLTGAAN